MTNWFCIKHSLWCIKNEMSLASVFSHWPEHSRSSHLFCYWAFEVPRGGTSTVFLLKLFAVCAWTCTLYVLLATAFILYFHSTCSYFEGSCTSCVLVWFEILIIKSIFTSSQLWFISFPLYFVKLNHSKYMTTQLGVTHEMTLDILYCYLKWPHIYIALFIYHVCNLELANCFFFLSVYLATNLLLFIYSYALVQVEIKNQGEDAFKHELYGDIIIVERRILESTSSITLKTSQGFVYFVSVLICFG